MAEAISWREAYNKVLIESHNGNLTEVVHAAEAAIFLRSQELDGQGDDTEREEIKEASDALLVVKVFELGWPAPTSTYPLDWKKNKTRDEF
jgi:hypothetical protein